MQDSYLCACCFLNTHRHTNTDRRTKGFSPWPCSVPHRNWTLVTAWWCSLSWSIQINVRSCVLDDGWTSIHHQCFLKGCFQETLNYKTGDLAINYVLLGNSNSLSHLFDSFQAQRNLHINLSKVKISRDSLTALNLLCWRITNSVLWPGEPSFSG